MKYNTSFLVELVNEKGKVCSLGRLNRLVRTRVLTCVLPGGSSAQKRDINRKRDDLKYVIKND